MSRRHDLERFPEVTARMGEVLHLLALLERGGRAADDLHSTGKDIPRLWDLTTIHEPDLLHDTWQWLQAFVGWFNNQQTWFASDQIPACWPHHPHLIREIGTLADQRRTAGLALSSAPLEEWHHNTVPAFLERTRIARQACADGHAPWPGRAEYQRHETLLRRNRDDLRADPEANL